MSLASGIVLNIFKKVVVKPLTKKPSMDAEVLSNYRPVSNLTFISKILEKVVKSQLVDHLDLMNKYQ